MGGNTHGMAHGMGFRCRSLCWQAGFKPGFDHPARSASVIPAALFIGMILLTTTRW